MKFSEMNMSDETMESFTLLLAGTEKPCANCGEMTKYIDYCAETFFCSPSCQNSFYEKVTMISTKR